ncbi:MAG: translocation/assembly module TamB domain-containing protein, partial [Desulfobacteraceae bacterium]
LETTCDTQIENFTWDKIKADNISGRITANHREKNGNGKISIESVSGNKKLKAGSDFYMSGKDISLKNLYLSGMETELIGSILFDRGARLINGNVNFSSPDISVISSLYGRNIEGSASGEVVFKPVENTQNLEVSASAKKIIFNQNMVEDIAVKASMTDIFGKLHFSTSATINGFNHEGVILKTVDIKGQGERDKSEFHINGSGAAGEEMDFTALVGFVNQGDNKSLNIQDLNGRFGTSQVRSLQPLTVKYSAEELVIENLDINVDSGNIRGFLNYNGDKADGRIMVNSMPLSLFSLAGFPVLDGALDGSINLGGTSASPVMSGIITAGGIKRKSLKKSSISPVSIKAEYDVKRDNMTGKFSLDGLSGTTLKGDISIPGDFSIYPFKLAPEDTDPIKGSIKGEFDLAVIPAVLEMHDQVIAGRLDTGFDISGYYGSPVISGKAMLSKGTYENTEMGILVDNIEAEISADNSGIKLHNFKADDGLKGKITGKGHFDIDAAKNLPYEVSMVLRNMQLTGNSSLRTVAGGNTVISGSMKQHNLSGELTLEKAEFEIAEKLPVEFTELEIKEINRDVGIGQDEIKPAAKSKINFDLAVSSPGKVYIKGRGLDSEWKGDVKLEGDSNNPVITGNFTLVRGNYNFLARPFTLTDGQVTFSGNSPPDPYFDVTGKSVNSSITALINLKGSIKNPVLSLSSEPELPQDEILARVLFDREVSQITPLQALQLTAALKQMLGGKKGFDPLSYTRSLIGVDRLEVKQSEANPDESALSAGKYLKDNIYIEVEKGISDESGKASVTWELTPSITVETEVGEDSETGMGINWKYDY